MRYKLPDGQIIGERQAFTYNEIQYPENWMALSTKEDRDQIGVEKIQETPRPDDRFYWVDDNNIGTPKNLDMLKADWVSRINQIAYTLLAPSDWMVTRKTEIGTAIPADWETYRLQVRADCTLNKDNLNKASDIDSFVAIATNLTWPVAPDAKV